MIVVGVDGGDLGKEALRFALQEAALRGSRIRVVHAWEAIPIMAVSGPGFVPPLDAEPIHQAAEKTLAETLESVAGVHADEVERVLVEGLPGEAILANAHDAELIVVGTHARGAMAEFVLGSVSHHVVKHSRCPVVVVPPVRT